MKCTGDLGAVGSEVKLYSSVPVILVVPRLTDSVEHSLASLMVTDQTPKPHRPVNPHTKRLRERYKNQSPWRWLLVFTPPVAYVTMLAMGQMLHWLHLGFVSHVVAVFLSFPVAIGVAAGVAEYIADRRLVRWLIVIANGVLIALPWGYILMMNAMRFGK